LAPGETSQIWRSLHDDKAGSRILGEDDTPPAAPHAALHAHKRAKRPRALVEDNAR
jgi:hypothetical protein